MTHLRLLVGITFAALLLAVVLIIAGSATTRGGGSLSENVATAAALSAWSNFLLVVTAVAGIGAIVLAGVERALSAQR